MKLPKKVKIAHVWYKIVPMTEVECLGEKGEPIYGIHICDRCCIKVDSALNIQIVKDTLLHEIIHGINYWYNIDEVDSEERNTTKLATALIQVLDDNPRVYKFLGQ